MTDGSSPFVARDINYESSAPCKVRTRYQARGNFFMYYHKLFRDLAVEVGIEGALLIDTFLMDAMNSDDGSFTEPVKELMGEFPYLSYRKIHRGIQNLINGGYIKLSGRNHEGKFVYEATDKGYKFFFEVIVPSTKR